MRARDYVLCVRLRERLLSCARMIVMLLACEHLWHVSVVCACACMCVRVHAFV